MVKESINILLGVGNCLQGDDGAGSFIAQNFHHHHWITLDGRTAPENFTSVIKKEQPQLLVVVDAAQMNLDAGSFRIISLEKITALQFSTHSMPINFLIEYLSPHCQNITLIGIQPCSVKIGEFLSKPVLNGCCLLIRLLKKNQIAQIPIL